MHAFTDIVIDDADRFRTAPRQVGAPGLILRIDQLGQGDQRLLLTMSDLQARLLIGVLQAHLEGGG